MIKVRLFNHDDYVDFELAENQYCKLLSFVNRQENLELYRLGKI